MDRRDFFLRGGAMLLAGASSSTLSATADTLSYDPEKAIADMALDVPTYGPSQALFQRYVQSGQMIFLSGTIPFVNGERLHPGIVGDTVTLEQGQDAARRCAIQLLGVMRGALDGDWERLDQLVRVEGFVRSADGFGDQPAVMNAASQLFRDVLGDSGRHTRTAIGVKELPFESSVEIAAILSVRS
ncbi:MAG: RidA family protein [Pseudomonadota bacterium]